MSGRNRINKITTNNAQETKEFGRKIGLNLSRGKIILLNGDLGSGKTTFVQGLAKGLGIKKTIISPTFLVFKRYEINKKNLNWFYHIDLYRLEEKNILQELEKLGLLDFIEDENSVFVIEWASKAKSFYKEKSLMEISFEYLDEEKRNIKISES